LINPLSTADSQDRSIVVTKIPKRKEKHQSVNFLSQTQIKPLDQSSPQLLDENEERLNKQMEKLKREIRELDKMKTKTIKLSKDEINFSKSLRKPKHHLS